MTRQLYPEIISFVDFGLRDLRPIYDVEQRLVRQGIHLEVDDTWPDARYWNLEHVRLNVQKEAVVRAAKEVEDMGFKTEYQFGLPKEVPIVRGDARPGRVFRRPVRVHRYRRRR